MHRTIWIRVVPVQKMVIFFYARLDAAETEEAINKFISGLESQELAGHAWVVCQLKRLVPGRRLLRRRGSCAVLKLAGVARLIWPDGK